uniref:Ubiquitin-like domain-containing protein n=1 Tax=Capra hircus TaxID=9925 RepID=A0A8C2RSW3_CAPHI
MLQLSLRRLQADYASQVSEDELVSTLKHLVSEKLNIPVRQQRLLFKGKALAGNQGEGTPGKPGDGASSPGPGSSVGGGGSG